MQEKKTNVWDFLISLTHLKANPITILGFFIITAGFTLLTAVIFNHPKAPENVVIIIIQAIISIITAVTFYYFGASKSSKVRDETINKAISQGLNNNQNTQP